MILSEKVEITLNSANFEHFHSLGYTNLKNGNKLIVPIKHLNKGSHSIIKVKCDICNKEKNIEYRFYLSCFNRQNFYTCSSKCGKIKSTKTCIEKYGKNYYSQTEECKIKVKNTCLKKYNVDNVSKDENKKDKRKKTMIKKHGVEYYVLSKDFYNKSQKTSMLNYGTPHPMMSDKMKKIKIQYFLKMGFNVLTKDFDIYKRKVYRLTRKIKNNLINLWDGCDYYDNEYIKNNFDLPYHHKNYPTVDHKISIFEGFKNNITPEEISDISNLCFTKRYINSQKYTKIKFII